MSTSPFETEFSTDLMTSVAQSESLDAFFVDSLPIVQKALGGAHSVSVVEGTKGAWRVLTGHGGRLDLSKPFPADFFADVLDQQVAAQRDDWFVCPLASQQATQLLVVRSDQQLNSPKNQAIVAVFGATLQVMRRMAETSRTAFRRKAMLEMTMRWNQSQETGDLLQTMATTSTELMNAERATIFLLDSAGSKLIGRPALGVDGGELRISKDTGVVGQVVSTGESARVDQDIAMEQMQIDRAVDEKLGFETRSLLCVPMFGSKGQTIGAFELVNKVSGSFTQSDELALIELATHAAVAIEKTEHIAHLKTTQRQVADQAADQVRLIGSSIEMEKLKTTIERVAPTDLAVLILGENGTGKEVVSQMIHYLSERRDHVLVAVNCAAISETLLESELFGHEKGAFTDAHESRPGKFELANGGTLFLDEIGDMSLGGQAKLLRVLEEKVVVRVGGSKTISTDTRVVAATNQDLVQLVRQKKFREDLFFRLNVVALSIPPLRERDEDILVLANHFLADFCSKSRRKVPQFTAAARKKLTTHAWPGNVRELRNMMERLAYLFPDDKVDADDLSFVMSPNANSESMIAMDQPLADATKQFQAEYIERHVKRTNGNMTDAAQRLGLHRSNLYRKMKQLGMQTTDGDGVGGGDAEDRDVDSNDESS